MSSAEQDRSAADPAEAAASESHVSESAAGLSPIEGGPWRPVKPEELLRRNAVSDDAEAGHAAAETDQDRPKVRLERRQQLEHHLKERPTDLDAFLELGRIYRAEDRPIDARRILQQAIEIFPDNHELLWEYEEAILARSRQQLREVTELAKRLETAETDRELQRSRNDWACRRMEVCRARLERDPSLVHLRVALGEAMYDAGMYKEAMGELDEILETDEFSPAGYLIRGRCLLEMGKDVEAMAALRAASLRRAVVGPLPTRVLALRLLCETAERLGLTLTLANYRHHLQQAEQELAKTQPPLAAS